MSPPFLVTLEKTVGAFARGAQRLGPLVEERAAVLGQCVGALPVAPFRRDEPFLLERAQQAVEVAHLDPRLAGHFREPLEELVTMCRALAQEKQQGRLGEALDAREDTPVAAVAAPRARSLPQRPPTCKTHM